MNMEIRLNYEAPQVEIICVAVEQGFAASSEINGGVNGWGDQGNISDDVF